MNNLQLHSPGYQMQMKRRKVYQPRRKEKRETDNRHPIKHKRHNIHKDRRITESQNQSTTGNKSKNQLIMLLIRQIPQKPQTPLPFTQNTPRINLQLLLSNPLRRQIRQPNALAPLTTFILHKPTEMTIGIRNPDLSAIRRVIRTTDLPKEIMHLSRAEELRINNRNPIRRFGA